MNKLSLNEFLDSNSNLNFLNDIYFKSAYARLYGEVFCFEYKENDKILKVVANKFRIKDTEYFDIQSPYGYGGFASNTNDDLFLQNAFKVLKQRCLKEKIIAFFIRFHPFDRNLKAYEKRLNFFKKDRKISIVNTSQNAFKDYSSRMKSYINKGKKELCIEFAKRSENKAFKELYDETMRRNNASEFYFFNEKYFENLYDFSEYLVLKASLKGEILSYASFFLNENFSYYHLSANSLKSNANALLLDFFFNLALEKGSKFCILGGGLKDDDTLCEYKQKFSKLYGYFYIGGLVTNEKIYKELSKENAKFFLSYRYGGGGLIIAILQFKILLYIFIVCKILNKK